jgi:hypothetical protein
MRCSDGEKILRMMLPDLYLFIDTINPELIQLTHDLIQLTIDPDHLFLHTALGSKPQKVEGKRQRARDGEEEKANEEKAKKWVKQKEAEAKEETWRHLDWAVDIYR